MGEMTEREPMSSKRLDEIRKVLAGASGYVSSIACDLLAELDHTRDVLAAHLALESADAAAGSYAGRAKEAEARVAALTQLIADVGRDHDAAVAHAEQVAAALGEMHDEWSVLHVSGRDGPLDEADARRFAARAACAGARLQNRVVGKWRDADATPSTALEGGERGSDELLPWRTVQ